MRRICAIGLAVAVFPVGLAAQQSTPNATSMSFRSFAGRYGGWLAAAFDSIPAAKYGFKPTPVQQSVGYIAQHLEDANYQLCEPIGGLQRTKSERDALPDTVKAQWPKDTLVVRLKASLAFCDRALANVDDSKLNDALPTGGSGRTVVRSAYLLAFVTDLAEHYAQVASYMRLLGMVPPSAMPRTNR